MKPMLAPHVLDIVQDIVSKAEIRYHGDKGLKHYRLGIAALNRTYNYYTPIESYTNQELKGVRILLTDSVTKWALPNGEADHVVAAVKLVECARKAAKYGIKTAAAYGRDDLQIISNRNKR
ncbi:hypothetical protein E2K02_24295 [Escherichia coli]|uniref:hypothetical protein n=1 Tax=Enterobacteriaceae TaxID=543 RepID=UPI0015D7F9A1|nr:MULTISPECIES: hypothetical protein [Enterobacteriaceae]EFA3444115.1 hypothetical protein [Escherichia coli]NZC06422.1 hypothetical protein [Escherichia coli]ULJ59274.1 hypothetical protein HUZ74_22910 [Shigella flexneri]HBN1868053.1 hypothetical protein [Escherichia coli]